MPRPAPALAALLALALAAPPLIAQERFDCIGANYEWTLQIASEAALLEHGARLYQSNPNASEPSTLPLALTLHGPDGTLEARVEATACGEFDFTATVTPAGGEPLRGCCRAVD